MDDNETRVVADCVGGAGLGQCLQNLVFQLGLDAFPGTRMATSSVQSPSTAVECARARVCVRAWERACVRAYVRACVRACVRVHT